MMQSVQLIIERLKNNPEDFFGDLGEMKGLGIKYPKFHEITAKLDDLLLEKPNEQFHRLWYLEPDEKEALLAAYKEARRARFEAQTFHTLLTKQEREEDTGSITFRKQGTPQWTSAVLKVEGSPV